MRAYRVTRADPPEFEDVVRIHVDLDLDMAHIHPGPDEDSIRVSAELHPVDARSLLDALQAALQ